MNPDSVRLTNQHHHYRAHTPPSTHRPFSSQPETVSPRHILADRPFVCRSVWGLLGVDELESVIREVCAEQAVRGDKALVTSPST